MIYNVSTLLSKPIGEIRRHEFSLKSFNTGNESFFNLECNLKMIKTHKNILVYGDISTDLEDICNRCLVPIKIGIKTSFEEEFISLYNTTTNNFDDYYEEDLNSYIIDKNNELDLSKILKDHLISIIPIKKLCKITCLGKCTLCAINLNLEKCNCN